MHGAGAGKIEHGEPLAVIYATTEAMLREPSELLRSAITIASTSPQNSCRWWGACSRKKMLKHI